jgi:hypothetical protein
LVATFGTGNPGIFENVDDGPAEPLGDLHEDETLVCGRLAIRADTEVKCCFLHPPDDLMDRLCVKEKGPLVMAKTTAKAWKSTHEEFVFRAAYLA